jgi:hypothetical protein
MLSSPGLLCSLLDAAVLYARQVRLALPRPFCLGCTAAPSSTFDLLGLGGGLLRFSIPRPFSLQRGVSTSLIRSRSNLTVSQDYGPASPPAPQDQIHWHGRRDYRAHRDYHGLRDYLVRVSHVALHVSISHCALIARCRELNHLTPL